MTHEHHVDPAACWKCGKVMDGAFNPHGDEAPAPGDASFCLYCAAPLIYTGTAKFREPTEAEYLKFSQIPAWQRIRRVVEAILAQKK